MKKKYIIIFTFAIIAILAIIIFLLSQINASESTTSKQLKTTVYSNYETLQTAFSEADSHSEIIDYLYNWSIDNELSAVKSGNILQITKPASDDFFASPSVTFHLDVNLEDTKDLAQSTSIALSTLLGSKPYGEVSILFTPSNEFDYYGVLNIPDKMLDTDYFISLRYFKDSGIKTTTGCENEVQFNSTLEYTEPTYDKAYTMTLSGLNIPNNSYDLFKEKNPILAFSSFMSNLNNDSIYFDYVDFEAGNSGEKFPYSVKVTLLFDERNSEKFISRSKSLESKFDSYYIDDFPDYSFSCNEVPLPSQVISHEDGLRLLGFLYSLTDKVYEIDSKGNDILTSFAITNKLSTANGNIKIGMNAYSITDSSETESNTFLTQSAELSDFDISIEPIIPKWNGSNKTALTEQLLTNLNHTKINVYQKQETLLPSSLGYINSLNPELNQVIFNTNNSESFEQTTSLLEFVKEIGNAN